MAGKLFGSVFIGFVANQFGRKTILAGGLFIVMLGSVLTASAEDKREFLGSRIVVGLGLGAAYANMGDKLILKKYW